MDKPKNVLLLFIYSSSQMHLPSLFKLAMFYCWAHFGRNRCVFAVVGSFPSCLIKRKILLPCTALHGGRSLGVKCKTCVKFLGIYITYDVQLLVEINFKQRLKNIKNTINLWKSRGLSIYGKVNIMKTLLLPKMIYPSSVICTPYEVIKEFNSLIFRFLWNGNDNICTLWPRWP